LPDDAAAQQTPPPVPIDVVAPTERSGSISISGGDFATPMVRKRTITKPRGVPLVQIVDVAADVITPPPRQNGAPPAGPQDLAPAVPDHEPTLHRQASILRGAELALPEAQQVTPPPAPLVVADEDPLLLDGDPGPTPPPELPQEPAASAEPRGAGPIPERAMQESDSEKNLSPLASTLAHIAEAQRQADPPSGAADEAAHEEDLELVDAPLDAAPAHPVAPPPTPSPPMLPAAAFGTPPPIPGAHHKTPGAEPRGRPDASSSGDGSGDVRSSLSAFPIVPEALSQRPRRPKRSKPWFEEIFDEDYLRTLPFMTPEQTLREVSFIEESLEAPPGAEILDVGCGYGRHAIELVHRGLNVTGLDLSLPLLIRAADEAQRRSLSVNFVHADMRDMPFERKFDGAYCLLTSFGYFDEDANLKVAEGIARGLKPGGRFLLDIVNRDYVVGDLPTRIWWEGVGCVVLEEVDFNFHTSRIVTRRSVVFEDGRQLEQEISVRAYSLHEIGRLLRQAGFRVLDISGSMATRGRFFGGTSRNLMVLSEKRSD
jgi:SAM-dependent methyltransferase